MEDLEEMVSGPREMDWERARSLVDEVIWWGEMPERSSVDPAWRLRDAASNEDAHEMKWAMAEVAGEIATM